VIREGREKNGDLVTMRIYDERFEAFFSWIQDFDARRIANEAEVKPEFVAELFEHLG
jgi:hypothetical protein